MKKLRFRFNLRVFLNFNLNFLTQLILYLTIKNLRNYSIITD
ncbi:hypothetical protein ACFP3I_08970 [Chryseobacterium arachidis]